MSDDILITTVTQIDPVVTTETQLIVTEVSENVLTIATEQAPTIIEAGIAGPQGPPGASGDKHYTHTQLSPSTTWTITHNLGAYPSVMLVDSAGTAFQAQVHYDSDNQITVTLSAPTAGTAYLN